MRKKFTVLLMSLLAFVGVAKAGVTDFPAMSDGENIKWYTISNTRSASGKYLYWTANGVKDSNDRTGASFFYLTGSHDACYIHNYATELRFSGAGSWTEAGVSCALTVSSHGTGLMIGFNDGSGNTTYLNEKNFNNEFTTWGDINDTGSIFVFEEVTDFSSIINLVAIKAAAKAELDNLANIKVLFSSSDIAQAKVSVDAVQAKSNGLADLDAAAKAIEAIVINVKKSINGKDVRFTTYGRNATDGSDITAASNGTFLTTLSGDAGIWTLKSNDDGTFKMYNFLSNLYLGVTEGNGKHLATSSDFAKAGSYTFNPISENRTNLQNNGNSLHADGYGKVVQWNPDNTIAEASIWTVVSCDPIAITRGQYEAAVAAKNALPYAIQQAYGLVKDASKYSSNAPETDPNEKSSYANLLDNNYSSYFHSAWSYGVDGNHYLQAEVSEEVKDFCFYFKKRHNTNNNRPTEIDILGSTDGTEFTKITTINSGLPTIETDVDYFSPEINATENVKYLRFVVKNTNTGSVYFHFSEFYIFPAVSDVFSLFESYYSFGATSITDEGIAEVANGLINAENTLALSNIKKEIQTILNANKDNHEEVPSLGKYSTAGYNALEAAYENLNATQESLENAIAAFEASLNCPVYFITSAWDGGYPAGSAIYYDGMNWLWKKANKFDRQMWMTIPGYTNGDVPSVDAYDKDGTHYGFYDYFTGTKMRNLDVQIVAIPSWSDAFNLQYSETANNAVMHAQQDKKLVGWNPATISSNQASAWKIEYLGSSYSLSKLTKEKLEALANLQAAFDSKSYLFNATYGDGLGQYKDNGNAESIYNTLMEVAQFLSSKLSLFADEGCTIEEINALTDALNAIEVSINMPEDGKYYRIWGANNVIPSGYYITCHTNNDGGRIALTAEANASTIYYYKDGKLQAYLNGKYIATSSNHYVFDNKDHAASDITFEASNRVAGAFTIKSAGVFLHYKPYYDAVELDRCGVDEAVGHDWYLQEVTMEEINKDIVTDLNQVSDVACYKIYGARGFMYVDAAEGIVKSTYVNANKNVAYSPVNEYHNFAIVNIDGKSYLYSVGAKKFVVKSDNTVALVDFPEQEITIEAATDQSTDYDWLIKMGGTNLLNITNQHNSGIYTNYNTEDPGNRWALRKVGKFDPEYATSVRKVSVSYTVDGKTTTKAHAIKEGNTFSFTIPNASFSVVKSCKLGTEEMKDAEGGKFSFVVEGDTTLSVEIETNLPIKVAENANNIPADAWYYFVMHSNQRKYIQYLPDSTYIEWTDAAVHRDSIDTYSWALVGNVLDGFKLVNKAAKDMALLSKGSGNPSMDAYANGTAFLLDSTSTKIEGAFCLKYPNGDYLNANNGKVAHWSAADAGSTIIPALSPSESLAELAALLPYAGTVATIDNDKAEALTTAISAAQEVYNTSTDNAAVEAQVTALNTAIDNVIKAEVDAGLFRLKNSASGLYMTIVTPEAAAGIQIKAKDSDATKQAFYIESTAEAGVYNIKSTENYFMASSGAWNYGAYQTANEAGRAHKVEYLGEGKYALKTLLGYAGPNKGATVDASPLYSNHTADNNGREWELEALVKSNITYIYKDGETEIARQEVSQFVGLPYPAANVTLPLGYTATVLEGNVAEGETEKVVACVLNAEAIPFSYYASYKDVEQWYYLNFTAAHNYLYYAADNTVLDATQTEINRADREAYAWAFIGTPATGFQVVNKKAGNAKGLKALKSDAVTGAVVGEGAHTFKLTASASIADVKGFYMAAINGESADRFNKQNNQVVYWDGADAGSTFTVTVCPFGAVAELEALIVTAEELKATVDANTGDKIGEYAAATGETLAAAIETAKTKGDAATADDVAALQLVIDGTKVILPTAGSYYQFHSAVAFAETKAVYSDESSALWKTLNSNDKSFYWKAVENNGGIALQNAKSGKYLNGNATQSGAWSVSDTPANIDVKILTKEGANGYQYGVILNGWQMHANQHNNGNGTASNIVSWNAEAGSASAWYITEVELPEFCEIVYNFTYEGVTKFTQTALLAPGAEFPEIAISLPYGVSTNAAKPNGTVTESQTFEFTLNIDKALPFEAVATGTPSKWYYTQMHANTKYGFYVSADENNLVWQGDHTSEEAKYIADNADLDDYLWGFVGNLWDGFKMVNKAGKAVSSTGSGDVTVVDDMANATAFMAWNSSTESAGDWFCLKYPTNNNYLNLNYQNRVIQHWSANDNGSSFFVTEVGKEYALTIAGKSGYATYYSDYRLAIPENVEAYIVEGIEEGYADFVRVEGVIPAHTGIILKGVEGQDVAVTFETSAAATADVSKNHLKGTTTRQLITPSADETCYVLANPADGDGVGLYKATLKYNDGTAFYNNANKIYLPVPVAGAQAPRALMFRFGGTTEIEGSEFDAQDSQLIFDLAGRRIEKIVEKGIYIVNGKKVIIR